MRLWQRLIAIFLVITFVPATLAAAMPLVYCPGADGHPGIELAYAQSNWPDASAPTSAKAWLRDMATVAPADCVDVKLLSFTSVPQRSADAKNLPGKSPVLFGVEVVGPDLAQRTEVFPRLISTAIDRLAAHRTVVLQI